jgi:hypothetical protein
MNTTMAGSEDIGSALAVHHIDLTAQVEAVLRMVRESHLRLEAARAATGQRSDDAVVSVVDALNQVCREATALCQVATSVRNLARQYRTSKRGDGARPRPRRPHRVVK